MQLRISLAVSFWVMVACTDERVAGLESPVVYGDDSRREVYDHPSEALRNVAGAVAVELYGSWLEESGGEIDITYERTLGEAKDLCSGQRFADQLEPGTCSGTLIDERYILTAGHCVDEEDDCNGETSWVLGFRYASAGTLATLTPDDVYQCSRIVAWQYDDDADYAVIELDRPVVGHTPATLDDTALEVRDSVALIGHPNGIPMKIDSEGTITGVGSPWLDATVDAFSGNSGSGIFDQSGALRAILTGGEDDYTMMGSCNVVNVIDPPPTDDGESLFPLAPALRAFCNGPGVDSDLCDCEGPCNPLPPGDACDMAEEVTATSQTISDTIRGFSSDHSGSCAGAGPDRVYTFTLSERMRFLASITGFDTVLYLRAGCSGDEIACNDDRSDDDLSSSIEATLSPGTYVLFVDAYAHEVADFNLELTFAEVIDTPDAGSTDTDAGSTLVDAGPDPVDASDSNTDAAMMPAAEDEGGCGCSTPGSRSGSALPMIALMLLAFRRRRIRTYRE